MKTKINTCARCNVIINDYQYFFDKGDNLVCFTCFMDENPDIKYNDDLANVVFKMGIYWMKLWERIMIQNDSNLYIF